jgi:TRAP-type C4-dicarboxylate transport system permease small subunit
MVLMSIFMTVYGTKLVITTWHNSIADFPALSVGVTYLPIPLGGAILFLFVVERILLGAPPAPASHH